MPTSTLSLHQPVSYESKLAARALDSIDLLVVHCTELPDLSMARDYAERIQYPVSQTGACGHYYLSKSGQRFEYVSPDRIAHHCVGYNERSVGIELDNLGRYPDWLFAKRQHMSDPYPLAQIDALITLIEDLLLRLPRLRWIAGHEVLDVQMVAATDDAAVLVHRKMDPGPLFPWTRIESVFGTRLRLAVPD